MLNLPRVVARVFVVGLTVLIAYDLLVLDMTLSQVLTKGPGQLTSIVHYMAQTIADYKELLLVIGVAFVALRLCWSAPRVDKL